MTWSEFAKIINGIFENSSNTFIGGEIVISKISSSNKNSQFFISKKVRRVYGESSNFNLEKLRFEYYNSDNNFGESRISRRGILDRILITQKNQYKVEGNFSEQVKNLQLLTELEYLLSYPKSEFILLRNRIIFNAESIGEMKEDLLKIHSSFNSLKEKLIEK